jgi:hypothetical protein
MNPESQVARTLFVVALRLSGDTERRAYAQAWLFHAIGGDGAVVESP